MPEEPLYDCMNTKLLLWIRERIKFKVNKWIVSIKMRITHITGGGLDTGAGRGIQALHQGLLAHQIDSNILGVIEADLKKKDKITSVSTFERICTRLKNGVGRYLIKKLYGPLPPSFSPMGYGFDMHRHKIYMDSEILHIQWMNSSVFSNSCWRALRQDLRPVVVTLRDMWPFTRGCHFSGFCKGYTLGCTPCPLLDGSRQEEIAKNELAFKIESLPANASFIAISKKMRDMAQESTILRGKKIHLIPNAAMLDDFDNIPKNEAREKLGLPRMKFIIAFGALNLSDARKGGATIRQILRTFDDDPRVHFSAFGNGLKKMVNGIPTNCTDFGLVDNNALLSLIYSAADVYLMPSLQESFGKVTIEAMACGTPVIAYLGTPAEEMLRHGETGWLIPMGDVNAFSDAVRNVIGIRQDILSQMGLNASLEARKKYSPTKVAEKHINLYQSLLDG